MNKKILLPLAAFILVGGIGSFGVAKVYADDNSYGFRPMIQKLIERFNLDEEEVRNFIEEQRDANIEQRHALIEEKLNEAVENGVITEE